MANQAGDGDGGQGQAAAGTIDVDGKSYSAEDVASLVKQQANATQALQKAAPVLKLAEKYGTDPDGLVKHVEGSAIAINKLIDAGLIDDEGNIVEKSQGGGQDDFLQSLLGDQSGGGAGAQEPKVDQVVAKALEKVNKTLTTVTEEVNGLKSENATLKRQMMNDRIKKEYPDLDDDDIAKAMGTASQRGLTLRDALEQTTKANQERTAKLKTEMQEKLIKELGLTEDQVEKLKKSNELKELGPEGGSAVLIGKKKISFRKGEGTVTPRELTEQFLQGSGL